MSQVAAGCHRLLFAPSRVSDASKTGGNQRLPNRPSGEESRPESHPDLPEFVVERWSPPRARRVDWQCGFLDHRGMTLWKPGNVDGRSTRSPASLLVHYERDATTTKSLSVLATAAQVVGIRWFELPPQRGSPQNSPQLGATW